MVERVFVTRVETPADGVNGTFVTARRSPQKEKAAPEGGFNALERT
jgi:hypothetical protein